MKKLFTFAVLSVLTCLLGGRVLAQTRSASNTSFTHEVLDFTQLNPTGGLGNNSWDGNFLVSQNGTSYSFLSTRRISVSNTNGWNIWTSSTNNDCPYLQRETGDTRNVIINNLNVGDIVRIWCAGNCRILTDNTAIHDSNNPLVWNHIDPDPNYTQQGNWGYDERTVNNREGVQLTETFNYDVNNPSPTPNELKIVNNHDDGTLVIRLTSRYSGIIKIEIDAVNTNPRYDYDASLEVYDMYQTRNDAGNANYTANETAGFKLNNNDSYYLKFTNNDLTLNERIAIDKTNTWTFAHGIQAPSNWSNLSICNLREGDRVLIYYTGDAPIFSSNGNSGDYTGNAAYKDTWNDGMLDTNEGDHIITKGDPVEYTYCRKEGAFGNEEDYPHIWIYTSYPYVMMENGHLDLALSNGNHTRIVKIKIYSDHQAMMVDDYNNETYTYTAYYNITGELQAKEHIVPGGLEVHVGNDAADQHANVVFSKEGPVSYVKAVDGFKLPGITKVNGAIQNDFELANHAPETGTYYRFIPEANGKMTIRFKAASLNYYRWNLPGDAIYFDDPNTGDPITGETGWTEEFDRANEWPVDRNCPYYLKVQDGNQYRQPAGLKVSYNNGQTFSDVGNNTLQIHNGEYCTLTLDVQAGKTYYLYGAWSGSSNIAISPRNDNNSDRDACGVAQLLWIEFAPENKIYPLAKWVPSGTEAVDATHYVLNPDDLTTKEYELADVIGYNNATITVKKMSGNIIACRPYIQRVKPHDREGKLMIDGIQYESGKNPGGTILIKIGDPELKTSPLYVLTIAYSTDPQYNGENGKSGDDGRGHTWDLATNSLYGMKWDLAHNAYVKSKAPQYNTTFNTNTGGYATPTPMGTYFKDYYANETAIANFTKVDEVWDYFHNTLSNGINEGSLLEEEIDYPDHHGNIRSDWSFNYNLVYGDKLYDPVFTNKYDMEGDNADMIWDTEGTVIRTSANQSVIFNEFTGTDIHSSAKDPNRFVGILEGGEFRIPWLRPNDRVIIYMGTGTGRYTDEVKFNIRNAYDAMHNEISESDDYIVGGSHWDGADGDNNYRGCYHFFATGDKNNAGKPADMVFKMKEGSLCKIYKIQIYRGDRIVTNEVVGATPDDKFLLWSKEADPNDESDEAAIGDTYNWTLKYFGKGQKLADGSKGVNNGFVNYDAYIAKSGTGISENSFSTSTETDPTKATYNTFTYTHDYGQIGTFRARGKDMEKNMKYVADYGEHNVTVAYQQTMKYPYTWDFMDMTGWENNVQNFVYEDGIGSLMTSRPAWYDSDDLWNASYEKSSSDLSLWEVDSQDNTYYLRLNSQSGQTSGNLKEVDNIFETAKDIDGNQVWANGAIVEETQGLWFYTLNNNRNNGTWGVTNDGMAFNGLSTTIQKVVVPNVPAGAAVYLRMVTDRDAYGHQAEFKGGNSNYEIYGPELVAGTTDEYVLAIQNNAATKRHLTLSLAGYQLRKLAVSTDAKHIAQSGFATESRANDIDHELTAYLTGLPIKAYTAKLTSDHSKVLLTQFGASETSVKILPDATKEGNVGGCILYHEGYVETTSKDKDHTVSILGGGFHEFVPDMHDKVNANLKVPTTTENIIIPFIPARDLVNNEDIYAEKNNYLDAIDGVNTNMILSTKKYGYGTNGADIANTGYEAFFVRVDPKGNGGKGAKMWKCTGYIQIPTDDLKPLSGSSSTSGTTTTNGAKLTIVFEDELFGEIDNGIATGISEVTERNAVNGKAEWYSFDGQKLNGVPTAKGLYIVNGKKVLVK